LISTRLDARKSATFRQASRRSVNINLNRTGIVAEEIGMVTTVFMSKESVLIFRSDIESGQTRKTHFDFGSRRKFFEGLHYG
jgi:hypothetical protein